MEFKLKVFFSDYVKVDEEWQSVEVKHEFRVHTWDDLNNLIDTMIEASEKPMRFEVRMTKRSDDEEHVES